MNKEDFERKKELIRESFNDNRKIKCPTPDHIRKLDENVHQGGDVFTTEEGEFIDLEFQLEDFDEVELAKYIEFAENLYEKHQKMVSVYILCPRNINVKVRECPIPSEAEFTIKLACSREDPCQIFLDGIKNKMKNNAILTGTEIHNVEMLPVRCNRKDRNYFRVESLKILNKLHY